MDRIDLNAQERQLLGKKVKNLRKNGSLPAHVFGKGVDGDNVVIEKKEFLKVLNLAGETGLVSLKIGTEKVRPVLIREVQYDPVLGAPIHVDFYQVNLNEKVKVPVPLVLIGEQPESVKLGETIVLQTLNEVEVEALPADLIENIEIDITSLKAVDDAITVAQLNYDRSKLTVFAADEEVVVKLAPAVTAEMEKLMEEQAAEQAAVAAESEEGVAKAEGEEGGEVAEGEVPAEDDQATQGQSEDQNKPQE